MNGQIILAGSLAYYASEIAPTLATRWSSRSITLENSIDFALKESSHWRTPNDDSSLELLLDENDDDLEDDDDDNDYNGRRLPAYLHIEGWLLYKIESEILQTAIWSLYVIVILSHGMGISTVVSVSIVQPSINLEFLCTYKTLKMSLYNLF